MRCLRTSRTAASFGDRLSRASVIKSEMIWWEAAWLGVFVVGMFVCESCSVVFFVWVSLWILFCCVCCVVFCFVCVCVVGFVVGLCWDLFVGFVCGISLGTFLVGIFLWDLSGGTCFVFEIVFAYLRVLMMTCL